MDIHVLNVLQLYAYIIGWWQYDIFYNVMRDTGIYYLPIVVIFASDVLIPFTSQETRSAATTSLKRLTVSLISLFFMLALFVVPSLSFTIDNITYTKDGNTYVAGKTGTSYDHFFDASKLPSVDGSEFKGVGIPPGWALVLKAINGIAGIGFNSLTDSNINAREMMSQLENTAIEDPKVKAEAGRFYKECYQGAYADYLNSNLSDGKKSSVEADVKRYGQGDLGWMGSHVLMKHFYPSYQAQQVVVGFPFDAERDAIEGQYKNHPKWGQPMCNEWWQGDGSGNGLRDKIAKALDVQIKHEGKWYNIESWMKQHYTWLDSWKGFTQDDVKDAAIHVMLERQLRREGSNFNSGYFNESETRTGLSNYFGSGLSKIGTIIEYNTTWTASLNALVHMLPVLQALFLLALFAFMPFGIILSCFSWRFTITAITMALALIMLSWLWHLISYFDNLLITALYTSTKTGYENVFETMRNYLSPALNPASQIIDMAVCIGYVALPMFILGMIGWTGFKPGDAGIADAGRSAGSQSKNIGRSGWAGVKTIVKAAKGGIA